METFCSSSPSFSPRNQGLISRKLYPSSPHSSPDACKSPPLLVGCQLLNGTVGSIVVWQLRWQKRPKMGGVQCQSSSHHRRELLLSRLAAKLLSKAKKGCFCSPFFFLSSLPQKFPLEARCENRGRKKLRSCPAVLLGKQLPKRKRVGLRSLLLLLFLAHITCCLLSLAPQLCFPFQKASKWNT